MTLTISPDVAISEKLKNDLSLVSLFLPCLIIRAEGLFSAPGFSKESFYLSFKLAQFDIHNV